jgi:signal transduction histidine kinase
MFRGLRVRLTLLYLMAAMALISVVGAGAYLLVSSYFQNTTDLALKVRMAQELQLLGQPLPPELIVAAQEWIASRGVPTATAAAAPTLRSVSSDEGEDDAHDGESEVEGAEDSSSHEAPETDPYDGELAPIFSLPLNASGELINNPNAFALPVAPDTAAAASALASGSDLRTVVSGDGTRVRLLTYPVNVQGAPPVLQLGRALGDQDRVLAELLTALLALGGLSAVALTVASWWLAGRSLVPAEEAWEKQQAFIANASHELRTPLTLLRASAEVAERGLRKKDARRELMQDILVETDHMNKLVEDLLLLSRLDAGRLKLDMQAVNIKEILPEISRKVNRLAEEKGISLILEGKEGVVHSDPTRLRQVLLILLDNALTHTPEGGRIRVDSRLEANRVILTVADTGTGVAPEHLPHVFERFYRADKGPGAGSGLGLAIAKSLIEAQNGELRLESLEGIGTKAVISLPSTAR